LAAVWSSAEGRQAIKGALGAFETVFKMLLAAAVITQS
jgi:hypothetical protein